MDGKLIDIVVDKFPVDIRLYMLSDLHLGSINCDKELLEQTIEEIKNTPNAYWFGLGDYADYIDITDPRFDFGILDRTKLGSDKDLVNVFKNLKFLGEWYLERVVEILAPIANKGLLLLTGNHELTFMDHSGYDVMGALSEKLNIPAVGYESLVRLRFILPDKETKIGSWIVLYLTHGWGGGKSPGGKIRSVEEMIKVFDADIYVAGHSHMAVASKGYRYRITQRGNIESYQIPVIAVGGFRRRTINSDPRLRYVGYEEMRGYPDKATGAGIIDLTVYYQGRSKRFVPRAII